VKLVAWGKQKENREGIRDKVLDAIRKLEYHKKEVQNLRRRFQERSNRMFESVVISLQLGEKDKATIYANENAEIKKILKALRTSELALIQVILRLESIRDVGEAIKQMEQAFGVIKGMGKVLEGMSVQMNIAQDNIQNTLNETMAELQQLAPDLRLDVQTSNGEQIVEEAMKYIEQQITAEGLPDPSKLMQEVSSIEKSMDDRPLLAAGDGSEERFKIDMVSAPSNSIDDMVSNYIKSKGGRLDIYDTANAIGAPVEEVERSIIKLASEGKIKFQRNEEAGGVQP
jgi:division protein CdvB (Snf7/Vps24/ESCRT-III family)